MSLKYTCVAVLLLVVFLPVQGKTAKKFRSSDAAGTRFSTSKIIFVIDSLFVELGMYVGTLNKLAFLSSNSLAAFTRP